MVMSEQVSIDYHKAARLCSSVACENGAWLSGK